MLIEFWQEKSPAGLGAELFTKLFVYSTSNEKDTVNLMHPPHNFKQNPHYSTHSLYRPNPYAAWAYQRGWVGTRVPLRYKILTHATSPVVFSSDHRIEDAFLHSYFCALDFDESISLVEAKEELFCDTQHLIATTRSHDEGPYSPDRFRVWIPWEEPITCLSRYRYNMERLVKKYDADRKCKDGARFFFPSKKIVSINPDPEDYKMDHKKPPPRWSEIEQKRYEDSCSDLNYLSYAADRILRFPIPRGERNDFIYRGCRDLFRYKFSLDEVTQKIQECPTYLEGTRKDRDGFLRTVQSAYKNLARRRKKV